MPKITLDKQEVLKLVGKKITDKELESSIPLLGTDLEAVTKDTIEVEIFPNRPDMLSEEGFARALSSFLGIKKGMRHYKVTSSNYKIIIDKKVKDIVPYTTAAVVKGLKFTESSMRSLMNLQEKLHTTHGRNRKRLATGAYDLTTIEFPIALTAKQKSFMFHALDDAKERTIEDILTKHPKGKEYGHLVKKDVAVWIDARGQVLSMPPVINSEPTKVTLKTKDIFIEVTGNNKEAVEKALNIQLAALADRGGQIFKVSSSPNLAPEKIKINITKINKLLGLNLSKSEFANLASKMGLEFKNDIIYYPAYRADILHEVDIAEDIAIAYGYQNFTPEISKMSTIGQEEILEKFKDKIANLCIGLGLQEVCTYHLSNREDETIKMSTTSNLVHIKNSLSQECNVLRSWLTPSLLRVLATNRHNEYPQNIFEIGRVFMKNRSEVKESVKLAISICHARADYTEVKKILDTLCSNLGLKAQYNAKEHHSFIQGRSANVTVKGKDLAIIGELHPRAINNFGLDMPIAAIELDVGTLHVLVE